MELIICVALGIVLAPVIGSILFFVSMYGLLAVVNVISKIWQLFQFIMSPFDSLHKLFVLGSGNFK
jgi:hypothetical protein